MNNALEILAASIGAAACWILWFYFIKEQRVDTFREELFAVRGDLFEIAARGDISFQSPSYLQLRDLINSMLRFGHRISFRRSVIARHLAAEDLWHSSAYERWRASLDTQPEKVRKELSAVHERMFRAYAAYLVNGSVALLCMKGVFAIHAALKSLGAFMAAKSQPDFDLMDAAVNRIANAYGAKDLEEQAYRDSHASHELAV
jgi:hypothetical protein